MIRSQQVVKENIDLAARATAPSKPPLVWYCPSRWLLAHNDVQANICTLSSHMCLADLNNDGENLLALVDFKGGPARTGKVKLSSLDSCGPPYACRMRVYRGQQLIYNHFLEDVPSSLLATSIHLPVVTQTKGNTLGGMYSRIMEAAASQPESSLQQHHQQPLLTLTINEDVYFYHKLRPSQKMSLEDDECILESLNKSEVDVWKMARNEKLDEGTMHELLVGMANELGNHALTSHSNNFIALTTSNERKEYLLGWKLLRKLSANRGSKWSAEQIMSMDTICCSAARLSYNSALTTNGDYGQTRERATLLNSARWNRIIDIQRDGLVLGTEDRHLLIYELRPMGTRLEAHCRLPSVPDHILVERRSPSSFGTRLELKALTYKILVSCRDRKIYSLDQPYLVAQPIGGGGKSISGAALRELLALKSNVLDMCWTGMDESSGTERTNRGGAGAVQHRPTFVVACLDRNFYCFGSHSGQCKWVMEVELPITCLVCLPRLTIGDDEASLVGVASQANRFDFFVASTGRIVDSIYFRHDDFPSAARFGRFGREDNCLCLTTHRGHLMVFILKRTAKFAHGQCLSSAASYASDTLASYSQILKQQSLVNTEAKFPPSATPAQQAGQHEAPPVEQSLNLNERANLPSAFELSKSSAPNVTDKIIDSLVTSHDCDQVTAKHALDAHATRPQLQIPMKGREFVNQLVDQSQRSRSSALLFGRQMMRLRDQVVAALGQPSSTDEGNRLALTKIIGLGNVYRVSTALRLNVASFVERYKDLFSITRVNLPSQDSSSWSLTCFVAPRNRVQNRPCRICPSIFKIPIERDAKSDSGVKSIVETPMVFKLTILGEQNFEPINDDELTIEFRVIAYHRSIHKETVLQKPLYLTTINVRLTN